MSQDSAISARRLLTISRKIVVKIHTMTSITLNNKLLFKTKLKRDIPIVKNIVKNTYKVCNAPRNDTVSSLSRDANIKLVLLSKYLRERILSAVVKFWLMILFYTGTNWIYTHDSGLTHYIVLLLCRMSSDYKPVKKSCWRTELNWISCVPLLQGLLTNIYQEYYNNGALVFHKHLFNLFL